MRRAPWRPGPPLLALVTSLVVLLSWSGMVERPGLHLLATAAVGVFVALVGSGLRVLGLPAYAVVTAQLAGAVLGLNAAFAGGRSVLGVVPTWGSLERLDLLVVEGGRTLDYYASPVGAAPAATAALLTACGLAVVLAVDVLACGLRRPALAALPLLVALAVPISILDSGLTVPVFVVAALLFARLLVTAGPGQDAGDEGPSGSPSSTWWQVGVGAVVLALLAAPLLPVGEPLRRAGSGTSAGSGGGERLEVVNPFVRLRRDLLEQRDVPLLYARTEARRTSYLTTTVLDRFTSQDWHPSPRLLSPQNGADGIFPSPPGLATSLGGTESQWQLQLAPSFATLWLPLPSPVRQVAVQGDWRYDSRTLDVAHVGGDAPRSLSYSVTAFEPALTPQLLTRARPAPARLRQEMTALPDNLPSVIRRQARAVTRGATTDYAKAVALQEWFRSKGGFTYSLDQRSGSGMQLLADFVTTSRVGYCEQYAAAMAAMGRTLGIPSRVVVGFLDGKRQADGRVLYTTADRHAWPEMYFSGAGWVRFEPTPASRTGATPAYTRPEASAPTTAPTTTAAPTPRATRQPTPTPVEQQRNDPLSQTSGSGHPVLTVLLAGGGALLLVLVLALPGLLRRRQRRLRLHPHDVGHLPEGAWSELRATALDLGLAWPEDRSPREQARALGRQVDPDPEDTAALAHLLGEVERSRYAPGAGLPSRGHAGRAVAVLDRGAGAGPEARAGRGGDGAGATRTVAAVERWSRLMARSVDRPEAGRRGQVRVWRARVLPTSLLDRRGPG